MKRTMLLLLAVTAGAFGATAQTAQAAGPDSIMCTLAKKGIINPDSGPWCGPHNPPG